MSKGTCNQVTPGGGGCGATNLGPLCTQGPSKSQPTRESSWIHGGDAELKGIHLKNEKTHKNRMGVQDHQDKPLVLQVKENEDQRGAVTCFKATELSGWQVQASLPGGSSAIKNQT